MSDPIRKDDKMTGDLSEGDRYFMEQRDLILQDIGQTMDSILNNLNGLNISLENFIAVGKEFESVSDLWNKFYAGISEVDDSADGEEDVSKPQSEDKEET
ncbi:LADA_0B07448g1_1 [Lachancea dasiensis]|uniref:DASH complex subunit DAD1 n=1 Tax=Lachancea dasiensis TaxID=1072105 RepID=A0A1G4ITY4_9SACH|nr:LADA_0B07448g1_1 [Lachancea dasiensis]